MEVREQDGQRAELQQERCPGKQDRPGQRRGRLVARVLLALYAVVLVFVVVLKFDGSFQGLMDIHENILATRTLGEGSANFAPFTTVGAYLAALPAAYAVRGLAGGIVAFVPLGILLPAAFSRMGIVRTLLAGLCVQLAIESAEAMLAIGYFDIDDIILGMVGVAAGLLVERAIAAACRTHARTA